MTHRQVDRSSIDTVIRGNRGHTFRAYSKDSYPSRLRRLENVQKSTSTIVKRHWTTMRLDFQIYLVIGIRRVLSRTLLIFDN